MYEEGCNSFASESITWTLISPSLPNLPGNAIHSREIVEILSTFHLGRIFFQRRLLHNICACLWQALCNCVFTYYVLKADDPWIRLCLSFIYDSTDENVVLGEFKTIVLRLEGRNVGDRQSYRVGRWKLNVSAAPGSPFLHCLLKYLGPLVVHCTLTPHLSPQ